MSVQRIIQESLDKNPLGVKEALEAELQERIRAALEEKYAEMTESKDEDDDEDDDDDDEDEMDESFDLSEETMTVDIDHMGGRDAMAKKHNITLKKTKHTDYSHDATGKKKDLQKYLVHHYDGDHEEAKSIHPEVFK